MASIHEAIEQLDQAENAVRTGLFTGDLIVAGKKTLAAAQATRLLLKRVGESSAWGELSVYAQQTAIIAPMESRLAVRMAQLSAFMVQASVKRSADTLVQLRSYISNTLEETRAALILVRDFPKPILVRIADALGFAVDLVIDVGTFIIKAPGKVLSLVKWGAIGVLGLLAYKEFGLPKFGVRKR